MQDALQGQERGLVRAPQGLELEIKTTPPPYFEKNKNKAGEGVIGAPSAKQGIAPVRLYICNGKGCYFFIDLKSIPLLEIRVYGKTRSAHARRRIQVMGSTLGPNRVMAKNVKSCTHCCYVSCATFIV